MYPYHCRTIARVKPNHVLAVATTWLGLTLAIWTPASGARRHACYNRRDAETNAFLPPNVHHNQRGKAERVAFFAPASMVLLGSLPLKDGSEIGRI